LTFDNFDIEATIKKVQQLLAEEELLSSALRAAGGLRCLSLYLLCFNGIECTNALHGLQRHRTATGLVTIKKLAPGTWAMQPSSIQAAFLPSCEERFITADHQVALRTVQKLPYMLAAMFDARQMIRQRLAACTRAFRFDHGGTKLNIGKLFNIGFDSRIWCSSLLQRHAVVTKLF
jgi:hypothetical protein